MSARVLMMLGLAACSFDHGDARMEPSDAASSDGDGVDVDMRTDVLTTRGLVARYFIDEASAGIDPTALVDSAPNPLALPLTYSAGFNFKQLPHGWGLQWTSISEDGRASVSVAGTKLAALASSKTWTYEVVLDVRMQGTQSRIMGVNNNVSNYGNASLLTGSATDLRLYMEPEVASWNGNIDLARGRTVLHAVVATTAASDRATVSIDGMLVARNSNDFAPSTMPIFGATDFFTLGNVEGSSRSFVGDLSYAAVYDVALTEAKIAANTALLLANDDRP
ncbi:MAG TPA: LamG-like jellyroll fold domain-containing protein [Kofleriaceae bacterium]